MKISIITATYNNENTIAHCLRSLNSQTYGEIEHVIIDGASSDNTLGIIAEESPSSIVYSEPDNGVYDAINKGISRSTGEIIGFLHADDTFASEGIIKMVVEEFIATGSDGIYGDLYYVSESGKLLRNWRSVPFTPGLIAKGWMPPHPALFLRRNIYEKYGVYNTDYKISADYDLILRVFSAEKFKSHHITEPLVFMRTGGISNRNLSNIIRKSREDYSALKANNICCPLRVLLQKNFSKISQFFLIPRPGY